MIQKILLMQVGTDGAVMNNKNNKLNKFEPVHEISNNMVCATSKGSDQPAHMRSLFRAFARGLNIVRVLSY